MTAPAAVAGARMTERQLQDSLMAHARALGYLVFHATDARRAEPGFPDLIIVGHARLFVIECKSARGKLRPTSMTKRGRILPGQAEWLTAFGMAGAGVAIARPEDLDALIAELKEGAGYA